MKARGRSIEVTFTGTAYPDVTAASQTDSPVGNPFGLQGGERIRIDILVDSATETNDIDFKLQVSPGPGADGSEIWVDTKSVDLGGAPSGPEGKYVTLTLQPEVAGDQPYLPLPAKGRIVCTTGVGDTVTVSKIRVTEAG